MVAGAAILLESIFQERTGRPLAPADRASDLERERLTADRRTVGPEDPEHRPAA